MDLIQLILILAVLGFIAWLVITYVPMPQPIKTVVIVIMVIVLVLFLLRLVGFPTVRLG